MNDNNTNVNNNIFCQSGNHAIKYQYGPDFQNYRVTKMVFDPEGKI